MSLELLIAFAAGLVGFLSPCVLPLLPGYVGYMSGAGTAERVSVRKALPGTLAFVGGITVVFVSLGATASQASAILRSNRVLLETLSGAFVIALGMVMVLSAVGVPLLTRERRFHLRPRVGVVPTFLLGAAFAFGWTPCIGPTLGAALTMASTSAGLGEGVALLGAYSLGMGVPFVLAGLGLVNFSGRIKRHALQIQLVGGVLLVAVGILVLTGQLTVITRWMQRILGDANLDFWNF